MWTIASPLEWLLCQPQRAANDARADAENARIDDIAAQRIAEGDRRRREFERLYADALDNKQLRTEYHALLRDRHVAERGEERRWRSEAHETWLDESRRLSRRADKNLLRFIWVVVVSTWIEVSAIAIWV